MKFRDYRFENKKAPDIFDSNYMIDRTTLISPSLFFYLPSSKVIKTFKTLDWLNKKLLEHEQAIIIYMNKRTKPPWRWDFLRSKIPHLAKKFPDLIQPEFPFPCPQQSVTYSTHEPDDSNPRRTILSTNISSILILYTYLYLRISNPLRVSQTHTCVSLFLLATRHTATSVSSSMTWSAE